MLELRAAEQSLNREVTDAGPVELPAGTRGQQGGTDLRPVRRMARLRRRRLCQRHHRCRKEVPAEQRWAAPPGAPPVIQ